MPNFVEIARTATEIWQFFSFSKMAAVRHIGFVMRVLGLPTKGSLSVFFFYITAMLNWHITYTGNVCTVYCLQLSVKNCFVRGSVVRYVQLPADECDTQLLQDAARKEAAQSKQR